MTATGERTFVLVSAGDDQVGVVHLVLDVGDVVLLDEGVEAAEHLADVPAAFLDVPEDAPGEGEVEVEVDEDLEVEHVADAGVVHREDALEDDDRPGVQYVVLAGLGGVLAEAVDGGAGLLAIVELEQALVHLVEVQRVGVVEVVVVGEDAGGQTA